MTEKEILSIFEKTGALLSGHFILTSGLHSKQYFQCAQVLKYPDLAEKLCSQIAKYFKNDPIDAVIAPAVGGIIVAHEVARALRVRALFAERENGRMTLRRNFEIQEGEKILVVEDVITTGGSVREIIELVKKLGGKPIGVGCLVDRSAGKADLGVRYQSLIALNIKTYSPDDPEIKKIGHPAVKPGSRNLEKNG